VAAGWLTDWLAGWLTVWLADLLAVWLASQSASKSASLWKWTSCYSMLLSLWFDNDECDWCLLLSFINDWRPEAKALGALQIGLLLLLLLIDWLNALMVVWLTESRCEATAGAFTIQWCSYSSDTQWHIITIITSSHSISSWQRQFCRLCCKLTTYT